MRSVVFLFGEAERGDYCTPFLCKSIAHLADMMGNPPPESQGIPYAVQALLYERDLIFYRVKEEGFSSQDYLRGLHLLQYNPPLDRISAICMPGVGDVEILKATTPICCLHKSLLIVTEQDLYDYLTGLK